MTWKRTSSHNDARRKYADVSDTIFFYTKTDDYKFDVPRAEYSQEYLENFYRYVDENGRRYRLSDLRSPNPRPNLMYEYKGYKPHKNGWAVSREKMEQLDREGRLHFPAKQDGRIQQRRYLDEMAGMPVPNVWDDIQPIQAQADERMGYPTQKPLALLERIISASSNPGDLVLDPFCGCGTAVHAAQNLDRQWIGIDITPLAIGLIEKRMRGKFPDLAFNVEGVPKDLDGARKLAEKDKYKFQLWACALVGAQPYRGGKKGADSGIDGIVYFQDSKDAAKKIIVSVKGGEHVTLTMLKDLIATVAHENAQLGFFVTLTPPTKPMQTEAASAGFYESPNHGAFPKIQILTIEGLLNGTESPRYPDLSRGAISFKQAKPEKKKGKQGKLL
ncbi:MAG: restriction endonuclease [Anaerolineales bacterium]|nr:restriction endonuclease [Anaerolineales bacterium]